MANQGVSLGLGTFPSQDVSGDFHGSGAMEKANDPPPVGSGASAAMSVPQDDTVVEGGLDDSDFDDSPTMSPNESPEVKQKAPPRRSTRSPSASKFSTPHSSRESTPRRQAAKRDTGKPPSGRVASKFRASSEPRTRGGEQAKPPMPHVTEHVMSKATPHDMEGRLAALEAQQNVDHTYFAEMANAARMLGTAIEYVESQRVVMAEDIKGFAAVNLGIKRDLAEVMGKCEQRITHSSTVTAGAFEAKLVTIEADLNKMQEMFKTVEQREGQVADYLHKLHGERPREGQVLLSSFDYLNGQVVGIKEGMAKLERISLEAHQHQHQQQQQHFGHPIFTEEIRINLVKLGESVIAANTNIGVMQVQAGEMNSRLIAAEQQIISWNTDGGEFEAPPPPQAAHAPVQRLNLTAAYQAGAAAAPRGGVGCGCGDAVCYQGGGTTNPYAMPPMPPGMPAGSSGDGVHATLRAVIGGNGQCHCIRVTQLLERVTTLELSSRHGGVGGGGCGVGRANDGPAPLIPGSHGHAPRASVPHGRHDDEYNILPLVLRGPMGAIDYKDRPLFDDKLAMQTEFRFDGSKGGPHWKGKVERYFISRAPILQKILIWAEKQDMHEVTPARLAEAIGRVIDEDKVAMIDASLWGFLSSALTGSAETIFKGADTLRGFDAWRRIARYIDHGRSVRLEELRRSVRTMHLRPIRALDHIEEGIAEFENLLRDYEEAGGSPFAPEEKKADLLAILPTELREHLLWYVTDKTKTFEQFRDHVRSQTAQVLMTRRKLPLHAVTTVEEEMIDDQAQEEIDIKNINSLGDLVAVINNRSRGQQGGRFRPQPNRAPRPAAINDRERPPRKCANCGKEHPGRCNLPLVPASQRPCWGCGKPGHSSRDCPNKSITDTHRALKAIQDASPQAGMLGMFCLEDKDGFQRVTRGARRGTKPTPSNVTFGDVLAANKFAALASPASRKPSVESSHETLSRSANSAAILNAAMRNETPHVKVRDDSPMAMRKAIAAAQREADAELARSIKELNVIEDEPDEAELLATTEKVIVKVAADSGAVANVIHPKELPTNAKPRPNTTGRNFVGANSTTIERYGSCDTKLETKHGVVGCGWQLADVSRALHSISTIAGPKDGPGKQDVLFNNRIGVVVPPGIVDKILESVKPIMQYDRDGNLYTAEVEMSAADIDAVGFGRQGQEA